MALVVLVRPGGALSGDALVIHAVVQMVPKWILEPFSWVHYEADER